jgi:enoyl-CoA hydratase
MAEPVSYERRGAAALLTIDRQERRNAVDGPTAALLAEGYRRFVDDPEARVLVITGAGEAAFCAGADLKAIESLGIGLTLEEGMRLEARSARPTLAVAAAGAARFAAGEGRGGAGTRV